MVLLFHPSPRVTLFQLRIPAEYEGTICVFFGFHRSCFYRKPLVGLRGHAGRSNAGHLQDIEEQYLEVDTRPPLTEDAEYQLYCSLGFCEA